MGKGRAALDIQCLWPVAARRLREKKLVEVKKDFGDYYMVVSETLRAGDQVIVSAKNLYVGKVVG